MPIFGLGKKKDAAGHPRRVLGDGDRLAAALIQSAQAQNWTEIHGTLTRLSGRDQSAVAGKLCAHEATRPWLLKLAEEDPEDYVGRLVVGTCTIEDAWQARSSLKAQHVSRDQFARFHELLRVAEDRLYEAAVLAPEAVAPWHYLLMSGRGLEVGIDIIERRFESVTNRCPDHYEAHFQMLQALCRKWAGSHERMHAFARESMAGPHWSTLAPLVPIAHLERFLDMGGGEPGRAYLARPEVLAEIQEAADLTLGQPGHADARSPYSTANIFAMAFSLARSWESARSAFEATDWVVTRFPWMYLNGRDPKAPYAKFRDFAVRLG
ncbi:MAG TPA: hypothetical protein VFN97_10245 [Actinospica sp.]|nr:hypothetical protein [Actinospica sp.]